MVEGHSVHRVAQMHRHRLVGKRFQATSPNGRFTEGAAAIHNQLFHRIEAVGKNLFAFFGDDQENPVVVHVHFGMAGAWAVYNTKEEDVPAPTATNRLRLVCPTSHITADLSAMTVQHGGMDLYTSKRLQLGQDPLRSDADVELLWSKVSASKKSIGALIMDQSFFTGPGNIYRAEILFKAGIHPDTPGRELGRPEFDRVWAHTVALLQRGFECGSILTVDVEEAKALGKPNLRRYIYNQSHCPRCQSSIKVWTIAARTCYACLTCQPRGSTGELHWTDSKLASTSTNCVPFVSHCARESAGERLAKAGPSQLTIKELKADLATQQVAIPTSAKKSDLVQLWQEFCASQQPTAILSSEEAAAEKARAGENLAVEHIAELAPVQARRARAKAGVKREADGGEGLEMMSATALKDMLVSRGVMIPSRARKDVLMSLLKASMDASTTDETACTPMRKSKRRLVTP